MKKIIINGKKNIDGIKGEKTTKRKITENINKNIFNKMSQVEYLNKLYLNEKYDGIKFVKKEVERKLSGYKNQDVKKKKLEDNFITYEECLEKLVISKLKCYYCKDNCLLSYENVREEKQWTLDRIDNSQGHNNKNVVICCLKCNLKRRTTDDQKFKFTKQMRIIKTF
jgi:hypothetical protein